MKKIISALMFVTLAACAPVTADGIAAKEEKLWKEANTRAARECAAFPKSDPAKALDAGRCVASIVRSTVLPYAAFPDLVEQLIQDQAAVSKKYHEKQIDPMQAKAEAYQLQARYQATVMQRLNGGSNTPSPAPQ